MKRKLTELIFTSFLILFLLFFITNWFGCVSNQERTLRLKEKKPEIESLIKEKKFDLAESEIKKYDIGKTFTNNPTDESLKTNTVSLYHTLISAPITEGSSV